MDKASATVVHPRLLILDPSQEAVGNHTQLTGRLGQWAWTTALGMTKDFQDAAMTSLSFGPPRNLLSNDLVTS